MSTSPQSAEVIDAVCNYVMCLIPIDYPDHYTYATEFWQWLESLVESGDDPLTVFATAAKRDSPLRIASRLGITAATLVAKFSDLAKVTLEDLADLIPATMTDTEIMSKI